MSGPPKLMKQEDSDPPEPLPILQAEPERQSSDDEEALPMIPPPKIVKVSAPRKRQRPLDEPPALQEFLPEKIPALPQLQREDVHEEQEEGDNNDGHEHDGSCCEEMAVIRERTQHVEVLLESLHQVLNSLLKQRNRKHLEDRDRRARIARGDWSKQLSQSEEKARVGQRLDHSAIANQVPTQQIRRPPPLKSKPIIKQEPASPPQIKLEPVFDQPEPAPVLEPTAEPVDSELLIKELLTVKGKKVELSKLLTIPAFKDYPKETISEAADELSRDGLLTASPEDAENFTKTSPELLSPEELEPYNVAWKDYIAAYYGI